MVQIQRFRRRTSKVGSSSSTPETGLANTWNVRQGRGVVCRTLSVSWRPVAWEEFPVMRFKMHVLATLMGLLLASSALAQGTGRSLDIQPGGRQNGMGAAGVALPEDATGVTWWNPAALGFVEKPAVQLTYAKLVPGLATDVSYNYGSYVQPIEGFGAFGVG